MAELNEVIKLKSAQTRDLLPLESRGAQVIRIKLLLEGNSLLSTVWVRSLDVGASVAVRYYDVTSGRDLTEEGTLPSHPTITVASTDHSKITVTPFHNNPVLEVTVAGGDAEFSVWGTVVSSFATDIGAALVFDGDTFFPTQTKAIPIACYDPLTGLMNFIRCEDGNLPVTVIGSNIETRETGSSLVAFGATVTLISYTPTSDKNINSILVGGLGYGEFTVKIGADVWATLRNSWNDRQVRLPFGGKELTTSDTITIEVENITLGETTCLYEAFIYLD